VLVGRSGLNISRNGNWAARSRLAVRRPELSGTDVYGSLDELSGSLRVVRPTCTADIDDLDPAQTGTTRPGAPPCAGCPKVLDCWFDSGSMPFAQVHYPFENAEWFKYPTTGRLHRRIQRADPGLVLLLHVLATALFDRPAFLLVHAHGIVLGEDGLKMFQVEGNYPDVNEVFDRTAATRCAGSDGSPILRGATWCTEQGIRRASAGHPAAVEHLVLPALYSNAAGGGHSRTDQPTRTGPVHPGPRTGVSSARYRYAIADACAWCATTPRC